MSSDSESVIEFGAPEAAEKPRRFTYLRDLGSDRRVPALVAGIGGVAAFASLISEWQVTTMDNIAFVDGEPVQSEMFPANLIDLGGAGAAYLGGLFLLVTAVVLTLFGPVAGRRYTRLAGLSLGGMQIALLLAVIQMLGSQSLLVSRFLSVQINDDPPVVEYGRGIWCALAGVAAALVALWISDRAPEPDDNERRVITRTDDEEPLPDAPLELSITPSAPFAQFPGDRDQPHRL
ncbi:hypothetical protein FB565_004457 [Actinoplanes lutulentus]|nr:hypothetical protein [Actinoplanes lutulentus]MBB2944724.1 hypothetical protein [Actinoplanes lutulentus]